MTAKTVEGPDARASGPSTAKNYGTKNYCTWNHGTWNYGTKNHGTKNYGTCGRLGVVSCAGMEFEVGSG